LRTREDPWRLFLNLSLTSFVGGVLLAFIGAWLAAVLAFAAGLLFSLTAGWRLRRPDTKSLHQSAPAASRAGKERRR
jgi:membrane protein implicated in regulation of membrane protease activity